MTTTANTFLGSREQLSKCKRREPSSGGSCWNGPYKIVGPALFLAVAILLLQQSSNDRVAVCDKKYGDCISDNLAKSMP
ncbi:unnamed protein product [Heligmosomoides polygyrus]|uniref:Uncharacterized protein n=1 Tax=Heligmosomoides polygyrus TaxID=6339 RepID=A0A183FKA3_HELPZ|nr:unnamed protein product [Heligmosomoides polygyrus]